jgi:hypothetical protein
MTQIAVNVEASMINSDHGSTAPKARGEKIIVNRNSLYGIFAKVCRSLSWPNVRGKKSWKKAPETPFQSF